MILVDELETKNADVEKERELLELNLKTIELEKSELFEQFEKLQQESESLKCDLDEFKIITKSLEEEKASISESNATILQTKDEFETKYQSVLVIVEDLEGKKTEIEKEAEALKENIKEIQHEKEGLVLLFIKIFFFVLFLVDLQMVKFGKRAFRFGDCLSPSEKLFLERNFKQVYFPQKSIFFHKFKRKFVEKLLKFSKTWKLFPYSAHEIPIASLLFKNVFFE